MIYSIDVEKFAERWRPRVLEEISIRKAGSDSIQTVDDERGGRSQSQTGFGQSRSQSFLRD